MSAIKCCDIAKMVIDEASETVASGYVRDAFLERNIYEACSVFDRIGACHGASAFHTEVNDKTFEITLSMEFSEIMEVGLPNEPCFHMAYGFKAGYVYDEDGNTCTVLSVVFGGVWFDLSQKHEVREDSEK